MNFNFELILFYAALTTGLIYAYDVLYLAPKRRLKQALNHAAPVKVPIVVDYARSFFPVLLIVFLLRAFLFEPFRIPSGSLEPTLLTGDFILVKKFEYGLRLPVIHKKIYGESKPNRGDLIVFKWPPNPSVDFIKRVVGLPGDRISYVDKELFLNGQKLETEFLKNTIAKDESGVSWRALEKQENLLGVKHNIFIDPAKSARNYYDIVVPEGMYFVMGDNRDDSADSRFWGFVPDQNILGKAVLIWMSWDSNQIDVRWNRIGTVVR